MKRQNTHDFNIHIIYCLIYSLDSSNILEDIYVRSNTEQIFCHKVSKNDIFQNIKNISSILIDIKVRLVSV